MKISGKRQIKQYQAGDIVQMNIEVIKETKAGHLNMKCNIMDGKSVGKAVVYHTFGSPNDKGRFFFEKFLDAVGVPEMDIDEKWFTNKKFWCSLKDNEYEGKKNLAIDEFIDKDDADVTGTPSMQLPLTEDVDLIKPAPKKTRKKKETVNNSNPVREDNFNEIFNEGNDNVDKEKD